MAATLAASSALPAPASRADAPSGRTSSEQTNADRAIVAYNAMQQYFSAAKMYPGDRTGLYTEANPPGDRRYSYLWPFSRVLAGTITLAGIPPSRRSGNDYRPAVRSRMSALGRYFDHWAKQNPAYESYPPAGGGGDEYYDDQAWIGLAAAHSFQTTASRASRDVALRVFNFVYPGGWDKHKHDAAPGGTFWVQQGTGVGAVNHDRTATANAPNAELAFMLEHIDRRRAKLYAHAGTSMDKWLVRYLYNVPTDPFDPRLANPTYDAVQPPIMFDHIDPSGGVDITQWTYNQGATVAANVLAYRTTGDVTYLHVAEAIANAALAAFAESDLTGTQPPAFNAIFFRGLLTLVPVTHQSGLAGRILGAMSTYADDAWSNFRDSRNLFHFPSADSSRDELLVQASMVQLFAALAWDPSDYWKLP